MQAEIARLREVVAFLLGEAHPKKDLGTGLIRAIRRQAGL
jgi:predicted RNA binding protein YcfA (HicA-like mRNA interferase family)